MGTERNSVLEIQTHRNEPGLVEATFEIPDLPLFRDHFPTRPILPAFFIVDFVATEVRRRWPDLGDWTTLANLKLKRPLGPQQRFTLELRRDAQRVLFSLHTDGVSAVTGEFRFG